MNKQRILISALNIALILSSTIINNNSVNDVYMKSIVPDVDTSKLNKLKGGQANLWTERVPTEARADYQLYPRAIALAEHFWTNDTSRYTSFLVRLNKQYPLLDKMHVQYVCPTLKILYRNRRLQTALIFSFHCQVI